ncbi:TIGR03086 family protein [Actinomadura barringtoniae]|uniref:TIGR03086 family protein n=1 Tax=Actinomadura barringtoniae TaxID=1427535 RepID=A0A939PJU1_9ACTN|nr:TIGR03086 family metal-binding protein [Actinomadura barringtoniae]MBO2451413.1 TIGR03086 family protein [Actinomadura barringtoniae]
MESKQDSMGIRQLSRAFASTRVVLAKVEPGQLDAATPCASWDVRALINHFVGSARWGASAVMGAGYADTGEDHGSGDFLASYDDSIKVAMEAFGAAGVLEKTIELAFGEFSGADLMGMLARDQFTHGWDLARAIGHHTDLDPELAEELLAQARVEILDAYRGPEGEAIFGPIVEAPDSACLADRLAAFLGRSL